MGFSELLANADRAVRGILGGSVTYSPSSGDPVQVTGVFDAAYITADSAHVQVSTCGPAVFLRLSELPTDPGVDVGATVTIGGTQYRPREVKPDGLGGVLLLLHQV